MAVDHGVRRDRGGGGAFLAPRTHGKHNGLDFLAPIGTKLVAPCSGPARSSVSRSFGVWAKVVCPLPREITGDRPAYASIFFSHLDESKLEEEQDVKAGEAIGTVGKSGNASGSSIAPHVHVEIAIHDSERRALQERHSGRDQSATNAAKRVLSAIEEHCLEPNGFHSRGREISRARRVDPFIVLACLSEDKPALVAPKGALAEASVPWNNLYEARTFDVNRDRSALR